MEVRKVSAEATIKNREISKLKITLELVPKSN